MASSSRGPRVVRVLPDEPAIDKAFDYLVPEGVADIQLGDRVRVALAGRRVGGWVTALDVSPPAGLALKPLAKWSGRGPTADLLELAEWAAWRWAGRPASFLRTASPERVVARLPAPPPRRDQPAPVGEVAAAALAAGRAVVRLAPATDPYPLVAAATTLGNVLVLCPTAALARSIGGRLRRDGVPVAFHPHDWAVGAAGATVVGTRAAAWAPVGDLAGVVVVDEHDESHQQEQAPTWHARDVAAERARRSGVPCILTSPCPSLEALAWGELIVRGRPAERAGWPAVDVVDMRAEDPRTGLLPPALVKVLRSDKRVVCVLNRTGRARLLSCAGCGELARCERCEAAVTQPAEPGGVLACARCGETRPVVCLHCGKTRMKALRQGVTRVRDEIEALVGEPVAEVTAARPAARSGVGASDAGAAADARAVAGPGAGGSGAGTSAGDGTGRWHGRAGPGAAGPGGEAGRSEAAGVHGVHGGSARPGVDPAAVRVVVGTEASLHQVGRADVVAFLDLDQELLAPRYRAAEQALALLARAARLVGGRERGGRLLLQTHLPDHEVVQAAVLGDPTRVADAEAERRELLRFPPVTAVAEASGPAAGEFVSALPPTVEVLGPSDGRWLLRAADHQALCDALAATPRPPGRLRVAVDPPRI